MPAVSKAQQMAMAIAKHHPSELHAKNKALLQMSPDELQDFASTPRRNLPEHIRQKMAKALTGNR